ncbi:MAG: glycosyltransferase family 39 protein, partial [Thermoanaerobaculia bacterium]
MAAVALLHLGAILIGPEPGALSVDERTYWWMTKSLVEGHGLAIENGFGERPSPELVAAAVVQRDGRLVPSPPYLFPVLAAPFYLAFGFRGLFVLNALAFAATLALTAALAREIGMERNRALDAALILALATYLGDYAQGAWPHAVATLFVVAAAWAAVHGQRTDRVREKWAFAAGAIAGLGTGVRLDLVLLVPVVVAAPLAARPANRRGALVTALGCLPGLVLLAATNRAKFGGWSPLSYGREGASLVSGVGEYLPAAALGILLLGVGSICLRGGRFSPTLRVGLALAAGVALLAWPMGRTVLARWAGGLWQLAVDLRARDPSIVEPVLERGPGGSLVYLGAVKKSLLQSCPYLTVLAMAKPPRERSRRIALVGIPLLFVGLYAAFAWHGGLALNLRYWTPVLPFAAIGTAAALAALPPGDRRAALAAGLATVAALA